MFGPKWLLSFLSIAYPANATLSSSIFQNQPPWDPCPIQCGMVGSDIHNWGVYHDLEALNRCDRPMLMSFAVSAPLNRPGIQTQIQACSIWGDSIAASEATSSGELFSPQNVTVQRAQYGTSQGSSREGARILLHLQSYLEKQVPVGDRNSILFIKSGSTVLGFFGGSQLDNFQVMEAVLLGLMADFFIHETSSGVLEQICGLELNALQTWGVVVSFDGSLSAVQETVRTWSRGACVETGEDASPAVALHTSVLSPMSSSSSSRSITIYTNSGREKPSTPPASSLQRRASCSTIQVQYGDICPSLATRCGITGAQFEKYNTVTNLCSSLLPGQHVCCSSGTLPNYAPKPNTDGTCATYTIKHDDDCSLIAAAHSLTKSQLEEFNKKTWGKHTRRTAPFTLDTNHYPGQAGMDATSLFSPMQKYV